MNDIDRILAAVERTEAQHETERRGLYIGLRRMHRDEQWRVGDALPDSYHWDDGDRTDETIGGAAAFDAYADPRGAAEQVAAYNLGEGGEQRVAILVGTGHSDWWMPEPLAVAIIDAVVVEIITLGE